MTSHPPQMSWMFVKAAFANMNGEAMIAPGNRSKKKKTFPTASLFPKNQGAVSSRIHNAPITSPVISATLIHSA